TQNPYDMHRLFWDLFTEEKKRNFLYREEIAREQLGTRSGARGEPVYYVVSATRPATDNPIFQVDEKVYQPNIAQGDRLQFSLRANPIISRKGKKHDVPMDAQRQFLASLCSELGLQSQLPGSPKKQDLKRVLLRQVSGSLDEKLTTLLAGNPRYADRLNQALSLSDKLEWVLKATVEDALEHWIVSRGERHGFVICNDNHGQFKLQSSGYHWHALNGKAKRGTKSGFSSVDFTGELKVADVSKFRNALFNGVGRSKAFGCGLLLIKRA
ncbi:MAG: type I-E CRISPR-associated protein Cas6/Cse3/CasE, partial [Candidatus Marinimicrobia bacterium]|nr:type I-E CRISPR-associated protein Cas6/Cse3/CasE [Candidatus Neomarinimicrobiota bacterium]